MKPIRPWKLTYEPRATPAEWLVSASKYRVAIIREEGSTLGVWVAHGEGRCFWSDDAVKEEAMRQNCVALKYVDDDGKVTMEFPMDPNSLVGLTLPDGLYV